MTKLELIELYSQEAQITKHDAKFIINTVFDTMTETLANGDRVELREFCTFKVKEYDAYTGRNPKTGEPVEVAAKKVPVFKCGKELKERVDYPDV